MFAIVARTLECRPCEDGARTLLQAEGYATRRSTKRWRNWTRRASSGGRGDACCPGCASTVHYQTGPIQRQTRALAAALGTRRDAGGDRRRGARQRDGAPGDAGGMSDAAWLLGAALLLAGAAAWAWLRRAREAERLFAETRRKLEQLQREFERFAPPDLVERLTGGQGDVAPAAAAGDDAVRRPARLHRALRPPRPGGHGDDPQRLFPAT